MVTYEAQNLQAVEPESLPRDKGVRVFVHAELDGMGFNEVTLSADTREALETYIWNEWVGEGGDEDWFTWVKSTIVTLPMLPSAA